MSNKNKLIENKIIKNIDFNQINKWNVKFPIDKTKRVNFSSMMIAPRRSGKTFFINWLLHNPLKNKFDMIFIFTTSNGVIEYKEMKIPLKHVNYYSKFVPEIVKTVSSINAKNKEENKPPANILMIFDDSCSRSEKWDGEILDLYTKGRHFNISVIYSVQTATLVDNIWKENSDLIFIFKPRMPKQRNYIVENLMSGLIDKDFDKVSEERLFYMNLMKKITNVEHQMMVINMEMQKLMWFRVGP